MKRIFTKYHHSYLIDEETEVLRGEMTCLVLLSQEEGDLGYWSSDSYLGSSDWLINHFSGYWFIVLLSCIHSTKRY